MGMAIEDSDIDDNDDGGDDLDDDDEIVKLRWWARL